MPYYVVSTTECIQFLIPFLFHFSGVSGAAMFYIFIMPANSGGNFYAYLIINEQIYHNYSNNNASSSTSTSSNSVTLTLSLTVCVRRVLILLPVILFGLLCLLSY